MKIENTDIKTLVPYARNPRNNKAGIDKVASSIKEFGFKQPIVVDSEMVIIVGHTRYYAAKKLKLKKVPVLVAKDLTPAQAKAYRIADNRTSEESTWDEELLKLELEDLNKDDSLSIELTGFDSKELEQYLHVEGENKDEAGGEPEDNYNEQYGVIVVCENEDAQEEVYNKLAKEGYNCRVVVT